MKYIFVTLKIQNGEYEYYSQGVHELKEETDVNKFVEELAKNFYGDEGEEWFGQGSYYFYGGEVAVCVNSFRELTKEEYDVLKRFL